MEVIYFNTEKERNNYIKNKWFNPSDYVCLEIPKMFEEWVWYFLNCPRN